MTTKNDTEALAKRLEARTKQVLGDDWQKGLKCPECGSNATRPKCFHDLGGGCPRHDPDNYEPSPWQTVPDEDCAEAASTLRTLLAEREAIAQDLRSALHREIEQRKRIDAVNQAVIRVLAWHDRQGGHGALPPDVEAELRKALLKE